MTRIAGVDENVWTELYLLNGENLVKCVRSLADRLCDVAGAVERGEPESLKALLREGRYRFEDERLNSFRGEGITVTPLK